MSQDPGLQPQPHLTPQVLEDGMKLEIMDEFLPIPDGVAVATSQVSVRVEVMLRIRIRIEFAVGVLLDFW